MNIRRINWIALFVEAGRGWFRHNCLRLGASLSYCTLFSLFPLLLVIISVAQLLIRDVAGVRATLLDGLARVTGGFRDEFVYALDAVQRTHSALGIVGVAMLLMGASWVFGELVSAFNIIWDVENPGGGGPLAFLRMTFFSFALVLATTFLLLVSMVVSGLLAALGAWLTARTGANVVWTVAHTVFNVGVLTLIFAVLLKYLPQTPVAWRDVWLGAFLTAAGWSVLQYAIALSIRLSNYASYGAIGAVLALVAWVYASSQILFLGAEITAAYARQYGSRRAAPPAGESPEVATPLLARERGAPGG